MNVTIPAHISGEVTVWGEGETRDEVVYLADDGRSKVYVPRSMLPKGKTTLKTAPQDVEFVVRTRGSE